MTRKDLPLKDSDRDARERILSLEQSELRTHDVELQRSVVLCTCVLLRQGISKAWRGSEDVVVYVP